MNTLPLVAPRLRMTKPHRNDHFALTAVSVQEELQEGLGRRTQRILGMPQDTDFHMRHRVEDGARFNALAFQ